MTDLRPKVVCSAFGCHRWTRRFGPNAVYLCADHWRTVPVRLRRLQARAERRLKRDGGAKNLARAFRLWGKCVDHANRNQFGI